MSGDLVRWYTTQLDEHEQLARDFDGACWHVDYCDPYTGAFHERFDPTWALRDIAAKRRIVSMYTGQLLVGEVNEQVLYAVLVLAEAYAGRPGYREEWRPR